MQRNNIWILLGLGALYLYVTSSGSGAGTPQGTAPSRVPVGVLPLASNGYFQGPAYLDTRIGLQVTPYYFPSGLIAFLLDGAGVQYDPATGQPLNSPFPPLTS